MATIIFQDPLTERDQRGLLISLANSGVDPNPAHVGFVTILLKHCLAGHLCNIFGVHWIHLAFAVELQHLCPRGCHAFIIQVI